MNDYNVVLATDNNYLPYSFVACQSIIDSLESSSDGGQTVSNDDRIIFNLIVDNSVNTDILKEKCQSFTNRNKDKIAISFEIKHVDPNLFAGAPKLKGSHSTYYRIVVDKLLDKDIDTILYIDVDILVRKDIRKLFNQTNLQGSVLAACVEHAIDENYIPDSKLNIKPDTPFKKPLIINKHEYFNAGVLMINLNEWRAQNISDKCLEILKSYSPRAHDQDLLNYTIKNKVILDMGWNFHTFNFFLKFNDKDNRYSLIPLRGNEKTNLSCKNDLPDAETFEQIANDPAICHFTLFKPWERMECHYSNLPTTYNMGKYLLEWHAEAAKVAEFAIELSSLSHVDIRNYDFIDCLLNHKISVNQQNINKLIKGRKKDKKVLVSAIACLAVVEVITLILLMLK